MSSKNAKIFRVGVIGCGNIFRSHSPVYIDHPNVVLIGFYDRIQNRAEVWYNHIQSEMKLLREAVGANTDPDDSHHLKRCDLFEKEGRVFKTVEELIASVDVVDICSPTYTHGPYAQWALQKGKSVMVEKPPARCSLETSEIAHIAQNSNGIFQINENFLWQNYIHHLHDLVKSGKIGQLESIKIRLGHGGPAWGWNNHFLNPSLSGGGILADMGSHALGAVFGIIGPNADIVKIQSLKMNSGTEKERTIQRTDGINDYYLQKFMVEDEATIKFWVHTEFNPNPIIIQIETSWSKTYKDIEVIGSLGSCALDQDELNQKVIIFKPTTGSATHITIPPQARDSHQIQILSFFENLRSNTKNVANHEIAHKIQTVISGAYYSNLKGFTLGNPVPGAEVTPVDLEQYYEKIRKSGIPECLLIEEIVYRFMSPFTSTYYNPEEQYTQHLNLKFD